MSLARLRVVHRTGFRYDESVAASYNEARMTPVNTGNQSVLAARITVEPVTWTYSYRDYWGTQVTAFDVLVPHEELAVISSSTVELQDPPPAPRGLGWEALRAPSVLDTHAEYLVQTARSEPHEEVVDLARDAAGDLAPDAAARAVCDMLRSKLEYVPGSTHVTATAADVWEHRKGVCQDFAHLSIGALRGLGIPTRYVSGYLHPKAGAEVGETVEGQSHAWIEWWAGEWVPFDPTSVTPVAQDHVTVARGRDYNDVTPLKGIYTGSTDSALFVSVAVTRLM
ncbi:transglutaminase domain-containing protein [Spongisporangium articulatum]|uniref:Transglutaminase domain-containing protein n=1 Tax=Spongisporangium articulatum TaxID=3362603 RepID=A0ABW8ANC8_9ACTN